MADCELAHLLNLSRRGGFWIDVRLRTGEATQRALGCGVDDATLFHEVLHQPDRIFMNDDRVIRHERADANAVVVGLVDVRAKPYEALHNLEPLGGRFPFGVALNESKASRGFDHRLAVS